MATSFQAALEEYEETKEVQVIKKDNTYDPNAIRRFFFFFFETVIYAKRD
jgi:hypothetical protein